MVGGADMGKVEEGEWLQLTSSLFFSFSLLSWRSFFTFFSSASWLVEWFCKFSFSFSSLPLSLWGTWAGPRGNKKYYKYIFSHIENILLKLISDISRSVMLFIIVSSSLVSSSLDRCKVGGKGERKREKGEEGRRGMGEGKGEGEQKEIHYFLLQLWFWCATASKL